ncbi:MAG: hypothetical protein LBR07_06410, partial [Puniceicoccales bacterium]|nr:hypothetical protein [Puniceicoccales bacterium]
MSATPPPSSAGTAGANSGTAGAAKIAPKPKFIPEIDSGFVPAVLWNREYRKLAAETAGSAPLTITLARPDGTGSTFET